MRKWLHFTGAAEVAWIDMDATQFTLGDTADGAWTGNSWDFTTTDNNIRTALTLVSASQDFDFRWTFDDGTVDGPQVGFYTTGTTDNNQEPSITDPIVYARNGGAAGDAGWSHGNNNPDGTAKSAGWMSGVGAIQISRRGLTFYGLINGALDHTYTEVTGTEAGGFFIGCAGGSAVWQLDNVQYRLGPGLPAIS